MTGLQQPKRQLASPLQRALIQAKDGRLEEARAALDALSPADGEEDRFVLAHLRFALGEPLRAIALAEEHAGDDGPPIASFVRAISAALVGDKAGARHARAMLVEYARAAEPGSDSLTLRLLAGYLAEQAREVGEAGERFREVAERRGRPADIVRSLRALPSSDEEGQFAEAARRLLDRSDASSEDLIRLGNLCERAGHYDLAVTAYERSLPTASDGRSQARARLPLARLAVWRLSTAEARAHLAELGAAADQEPEAVRLRAMVEYFEGSAAMALGTLAELEAKWPEMARDADTWLVRAEASLALGRLESARDAITKSLQIENRFASYLLSTRIDLACEQSRWSKIRDMRAIDFLRAFARRNLRFLEPWIRRVNAQIDGLDALVRYLEPEVYEPLTAELSREALRACNADSRAAVQVVDEITRSLGGNRSSSVTRLVAESDGVTRLRKWNLAPDARQASSDLLHRLWVESPEEVLRRFEPMAERFPKSPFPFTYQGELHLWLGDYSGAFANFEEAIRRRPTRWAYIGMAAVFMLLGDERQASTTVALGVRRFGHLPTATTHVYRGELRRRRGELKGALQDLELAVQQRPGRVAARMNLALTYEALGRREEADRELRRALNQVPGIAWITAEALGQRLPATIDMTTAGPLLEHAFRLMRGNRSSWFYSIFDKDGRFRVLPKAEGWQNLALRELSISEASLSKCRS